MIMTRKEDEIGRMIMLDRRTGEPVSGGVPVSVQDWSFDRPRPDQRLWRYNQWWKFEDFVLKDKMYLRRSDKLEDGMEGRYVESNRKSQTELWQRFNDHYSIAPDSEGAIQAREALRYCVYINCWNMDFAESPRMWDIYTQASPESVAFRTTAHRVDLEITPPAYRLVCVRYAGHEEPRPEWHSLAPYVFKLTDFEFENECRILLVDRMGEEFVIDDETRFGRYLDLRAQRIVEEVVMHPRSAPAFQKKVREFCAAHLPHAHVRRSVLPKSRVR
jgi:hypothetical protein